MLAHHNELLRATKKGDINKVREILNQLTQIIDGEFALYLNEALSWAAHEGHIGMMEMLVAKGANIQAKDQYGNTPLHWAMYQNQILAIEYLMERGADQTILNHNGLKPLEFARMRGHQACTQELKHLLEQQAQQIIYLPERVGQLGKEARPNQRPLPSQQSYFHSAENTDHGSATASFNTLSQHVSFFKKNMPLNRISTPTRCSTSGNQSPTHDAQLQDAQIEALPIQVTHNFKPHTNEVNKFSYRVLS